MAKVYPDEWFGSMHRTLVAHVGNCAKRQTISAPTGRAFPRNWGGVRVFEEHPGGHGLHAHWVLRGRMDWYLVQRCALRAGFGKIVHVNPRPVTPKVAHYLANYLTKNGKLHGVRSWANIGTYDGIGKRDIVITSKRIERIKALQAYFRGIGKHRYAAYLLALQEVNEQDKNSDVPF
jgi:hypothetical protein